METTDLVQQREQAHAYLDRLPPSQLIAVRTLLQTMLDPLEKALRDAPMEDEEISEDEVQSSLRSHRWFEQNNGIPFEHVVAECGFTMDQILEKDPV